tara:strand:+ start:605 stop:1252 length:648 start_codon:yes stop_codon:yes gene_type:complete
MANTNDVFDDLLSNKQSYFVQGDKKKSSNVAPNVRGEFYGHLQNATMKEVSWGKKGATYKAVVYNYEFVIDKANENQTYEYNSYQDNSKMTSSGKDYIGRSYRSSGIFRFLEPEEGDDFISNSEGNKSYFRFCETIGIDIEKKVVQMDGQDVEVKVLPSLSTSDINGKPAIAVIDKGKPYTTQDGKERTPYVVKFVKTWEGGESKSVEAGDAIPF